MAKKKSPASGASQAVDRQLERYRSMRDFHATSEPKGSNPRRGESKSSKELPFVIQKHAATRLHYDFRLGWRGVLKSWAVTKGPSFYPGDKRLAVQVEDHPIEYGGFEGTIPKGQYGGGTVMVWDFGNWKPEGDVDAGIRDGHLKFELNGKKLKGRWALVRMHGSNERTEKPNWLLIKENDEFAVPEGTPAITEQATASALTRRSIDQIAASSDHVWNSSAERDADMKGESSSVATRSNLSSINSPIQKTTAHKKATNTLKSLRQLARAERFPGFIPPQLAQQAAHAPKGEDWVHELKLDGYRLQVHLQLKTRSNASAKKVGLFTRKGLDWTARMPEIARAAAELPVESAILDGEVVVLDSKGRSSFADLQAAFQEGRKAFLIFFAFDLLHLDGRNTRELPLIKRKDLLEQLIASLGEDAQIRLSRHVRADGEETFAKACKLGAEGIVSKLGSSAYKSGRGSSWLKVKCYHEQEFVIGGFSFPAHGGDGIGALLLGYYQNGKLVYAGRSGTGFSQKTQRILRTQLERLKLSKPPFSEIPKDARRDVTWVKPALVAQIAFANWTADNLLRQAAFKGLREDKPAKDVVREATMIRIEPEKVPVRTAKRKPSLSNSGPKVVNGTNLGLTHPDKILDAESGMTKRALAEYLLAVAEVMLPHVADRPLSVVRCPEGSGKPCFFQKHIGRGMPKGVNSISIRNQKTGENEDYLTLNSAEGLVGLAQMGVLEIHPWGSRNESVDKPDRIIFDLDPDTAINWATLAESAALIRQYLKGRGLTSFLKTTGGKGLHVVVPIEPNNEWPAVKQFAHDVVLDFEKVNPNLYLTKMTKAARKNRIYLDYLRNDREATAVAPWSPRARPGAPVAVPLRWSELKSEKMPVFHVSDFAQWEKRIRSDPWKGMTEIRQSFPAEK